MICAVYSSADFYKIIQREDVIHRYFKMITKKLEKNKKYSCKKINTIYFQNESLYSTVIYEDVTLELLYIIKYFL